MPSTLDLYAGWKSISFIEMGRVLSVSTLSAGELEVINPTAKIDPLTNKQIEEDAVTSMLTADIVTFGVGEKNHTKVPILTPQACLQGSGFFSVPRPGDWCIVGYLPMGQPIILGFYIPPDAFGTLRGLSPLSLRPGEIAICPPLTDVTSAMLFLQGGVIRAQAGQNALFELIPDGDIACIFARTFKVVQSSGSYELRERDNSDRNTFLKERIATQATSKNESAPFVERIQGDIESDEIFGDLQSQLTGETIIDQKTVNSKTNFGFSTTGSFAADFTDDDSLIDFKTSGKINAAAEGTIDIEVDDESTLTFKKKLTFDLGPNNITIEADPDNKKASITIGGTSITVENDKVSIKSSDQVTVDAETILLAGGAEGVGLGQSIETFLNTFVTTFNSHTHIAAGAGAPTGAPSATQLAPTNIVSKKVKAS